MTRLRQTLMVCAALLGGAQHGLALDTSACFNPTASIDDITASLGQEGWQPADREASFVADHLTWMGMPQYFAGDSGGQTLSSVLEMKRMSATGILRKKDLPNAKTRILSRQQNDQTEVAKIAVVALTNQHASVHCTFSLAAASVTEWSDTALSDTQLFARLPSTAPDLTDAQASKDIVALNRSALTADLGTPVPSDAIIETYLSFLTKE